MSKNKKKAILSDYLFNKASARKILLSCAFEIFPIGGIPIFTPFRFVSFLLSV